MTCKIGDFGKSNADNRRLPGLEGVEWGYWGSGQACLPLHLRGYPAWMGLSG